MRTYLFVLFLASFAVISPVLRRSDIAMHPLRSSHRLILDSALRKGTRFGADFFP